MRLLPGSIRPQIGLAYLLARTTDTIADTEILPVETRLAALHDLRDRILGAHGKQLDFSEFKKPADLLAHCENALRDIEYNKLTDPARVTHRGSEAERALLQRIEEILAVLNSFPADDQQRIRDLLKIITSGQELDLQRFAGATPDSIVALQTMEELDDYTYRVAGCVGEFWTHMCRAHVFPQAKLDDQQLLSDAVRFGKGLQLVNVLRDLPADLRNGRCYLPRRELQHIGLTPGDLRDPKNEARLRTFYNDLLSQTDAHLRAGWNYTQSLPRGAVRVRLACAIPILIGARTVAKLRTHNVLDGAHRIKISRGEVRHIMMRSLFAYPASGAWRNLYAWARDS
jgi:farnesyl-diphosphate farnesyltransferase